jgi:hypothetical protein
MTFILGVGFCRLITSRSEVDRAIQKQISRLPREFLDINYLTADALFTLLCDNQQMRDRVFNLTEILGLSMGAATTMFRQAWHRLLGYSTTSCEARALCTCKN